MASTLLFMVVELGAMILGSGALFLVTVFIHEVGHIVGGLLCGFEIESVRVGPFELRRQKEWAWAFSKSSLVGGIVKAQLRELSGPSAPWQCGGFLVAGPLANVIAALILARLSSSPTLAGAFAGWLAIVSIFVGILNLIPLKLKNERTDGAKLFWLMFNQNRREQLIFQFSLRARVTQIIALARAHELEQAIQKADELKARFLELPGISPEATQPLMRMREAFEKALAADSTPTANTEANES